MRYFAEVFIVTCFFSFHKMLLTMNLVYIQIYMNLRILIHSLKLFLQHYCSLGLKYHLQKYYLHHKKKKKCMYFSAPFSSHYVYDQMKQKGLISLCILCLINLVISRHVQLLLYTLVC